MWNSVTQQLMLDEKDFGVELKVRIPCWRSNELNIMIEILGMRIQQKDEPGGS